MNKFNVGDKVRIKENLSECEFGYNRYMEEFAGKKATVIRTLGKGGITLDIDKQVWNWSENVLELIKENDNMNTKIEENKVNESDLKDSEISKEVEEKKEIENDSVTMKRIDYILNAKDNIQAILDETVLDCDICPIASGVCNGNCEFHYKKYLNEEIEVDKSKLKLVEDKKNCKDCDYFVKSSLGNYCDFYGILLNIMHGCNEFQLKKHKEGIKDIKTENIKNDPVNHPSHYTDGNIEVMDFIEDKQLNFALGNAVKYISRAGKKDKNKTIQDLEKAEWYLNREIERLKKLQGK